MAKEIVGKARYAIGQAEVAPFMYSSNLELSQPALEVTNNGSFNPTTGEAWQEFITGIKNGTFALSCFRDRAVNFEQDKETWAGSGVPLTVSPTGGFAAGNDCYIAEILQVNKAETLKVGEVEKVDFSANVNSAAGLGKIFRDNQTAITATGNSTGIQLGALSAGKQLLAAVHVFGVSGTTPSMTVSVQNAAASNFTGAVTALTFGADTARGFELQRSTTVTSNTWWRFAFNVSGTSPSFTAVLAAAII